MKFTPDYLLLQLLKLLNPQVHNTYKAKLLEFMKRNVTHRSTTEIWPKKKRTSQKEGVMDVLGIYFHKSMTLKFIKNQSVNKEQVCNERESCLKEVLLLVTTKNA